MGMANRRDGIAKITLGNGEVRWRISLTVSALGEPRRQTVRSFRTRAEAEAFRDITRTERRAGTLVSNAGRTVESVAEEWLASKSGKRPNTVLHYRNALRPLLVTCGSLPIKNLDAPMLERMKAEMLSGSLRKVGRAGTPLTARSVNATLQAVKAFLAYAQARRLIATNPAELVERMAADEECVSCSWDVEQAQMFLRHVAEHAPTLFTPFLLSLAGLRRAEVLGLRWEDVDLDGAAAKARQLPPGTPSIKVSSTRTLVGGEVLVGPPKSKRSRRVLPLPAPIVAALHRQKALQEGQSAPLVASDTWGRPVGPERYSNLFQELLGDAGLPSIRLHDLRHTSLSLLADAGVPVVVASAWAGHSQAAVTHHYQHALASSLTAAGVTLAAVLGLENVPSVSHDPPSHPVPVELTRSQDSAETLTR